MLTHKEIEEIVVRDLQQKGYKIELGVNIYKEFSADILAEKEGKKSFIEIKSKRDDVLSSLINSKILKGLPNKLYLFSYTLGVIRRRHRKDCSIHWIWFI
ncbi:MAG: hypothetical protein AOA66_1714 [Candidatus Bathyarchaeota archaeon BA2]|nr:MAG: hypothetical protein AOA66_1714 [Candidatus Bathyarchaeota archaeon BA2]